MNNSKDTTIEKQIDAYLKGQLSEDEVDGLWIELFKQPEYIPWLQTEIDIKRIYRSREEERRKKQTYWMWAVAAAAVVLIVLSISYLYNKQSQSIREWSQTQINLADNLSSAQVTRSASKISAADSLLNVGFKAAIDGNMAHAEHIYHQILSTYNKPGLLSKVHLNLGILFYNSGKTKQSIQNLNMAIAIAQNDDLLKERAYWFVGNAYIKINQLVSARSAIQEAYSYGKIYKEEASELLKRLDRKLEHTDKKGNQNGTNGHKN